jgi:MFS family permease
MFLLATMCIMWVELQIHSTVPLHLTAKGFSTTVYGMMLSLNAVMIVLFELPLTNLITRLPPRPLISLGYGLTAIGLCFTGFAESVPALMATVVIWTMGEMAYAPVTGAYVTNLAPERYRGRYHGMWMLTWSLGMLLGPAMGSWIYSRSPSALWTACALIGSAAVVLPLITPSSGPRPPRSPR